MKIILTACVALTAFCLNSATGAVLTGSVTQYATVDVDLTASGTLDWAIWNTTSSSSVSSRAPTNIKDGGAGLIGDLFGVGGSSGSVRGFGGVDDTFYSYTDGTSPETLSDATQGFVGNASLDSLGSGVTLSISGDPLQPLRVDIWTTGFRATGEMTVTLNGVAEPLVLSATFGADKTPALFRFVFQPDTVSDVLGISYVVTEDTGSSAHIGIQAVAISPVPEPTVVTLLLGGLGVLGLRRRRK